MKKFRLLLALASLIALVMPMTSCENNEEGPIVPTVMLTAGSATQTSITFKAETSATQKAYYLVVKASDEAVVDGMTVVSTGVEITKEDGSAWVNDAATVTVKDLEVETEYLVYAAAVNGPETTLVDAPLAMATADKSAPTVSVEAVEADITTLYFRVTSTNAAEVKWLAVLPDTKVTAEKVLAEGVALDAKDLNKTVMVKAEGLNDYTAYDIYAVAKSEERIAFSTSITMRTLMAPPTVALEAAEVGADYANVYVTTELAEEVKWAYAPHGYEGVTAELVYSAGSALAAEQLNTKALVEITGFKPETSYDVYAVAKRGDHLILSDALVITTEAAGLKELTVQFDMVDTMMDPAMHGIPNFFYIILANSTTFDMASLPIYDLAGNSYLDGFYPVLDNPTGAEPKFVAQADMNVGAACFIIGGEEYYLLPGADNDGVPYGIQFMTTMGQGEDNNLISLNLLLATVDDEGGLVPAATLVGDCYMGPLGYSGAGAMQQTERDLSSFKEYKMTVSEDGNFVTLKGDNYMGSVVFEFATYGAPLEGANNGQNYSIEQGSLSGYYWEPLDDWTFIFKSGNLYIEKVEGKENTYKFTMSSRRGGLVAEMSQPTALQAVFTPLDTEWEVTITK